MLHSGTSAEGWKYVGRDANLLGAFDFRTGFF